MINLSSISSILVILIAVGSATGFLYSQIRKGIRDSTAADIKAANDTREFQKNQIADLSELVDKLQKDLTASNLKIAALEGQNKAYLEIFQGRDPKTEKFMDTMESAVLQFQEYIKKNDARMDLLLKAVVK